jgi:hypothetical protein
MERPRAAHALRSDHKCIFSVYQLVKKAGLKIIFELKRTNLIDELMECCIDEFFGFPQENG